MASRAAISPPSRAHAGAISYTRTLPPAASRPRALLPRFHTYPRAPSRLLHASTSYRSAPKAKILSPLSRPVAVSPNPLACNPLQPTDCPACLRSHLHPQLSLHARTHTYSLTPHASRFLPTTAYAHAHSPHTLPRALLVFPTPGQTPHSDLVNAYKTALRAASGTFANFVICWRPWLRPGAVPGSSVLSREQLRKRRPRRCRFSGCHSLIAAAAFATQCHCFLATADATRRPLRPRRGPDSPQIGHSVPAPAWGHPKRHMAPGKGKNAGRCAERPGHGSSGGGGAQQRRTAGRRPAASTYASLRCRCRRAATPPRPPAVFFLRF